MANGRQKQVFVAPGPESESLPIASSPWHDERWAQIPKNHWNLLLNFATSFDANKAARLDSLSWAVDDNEQDYVYASHDELVSLVLFMEDLKNKIYAAEPLVPEATEEYPDAYVNDEHVRMIEAVIAVFKEAIRLKQPFRAWVD